MPCSCNNASRLCSVHTVPSFSRRRNSRLCRSNRDGVRCPTRTCRQMTQSFAQRFLTPVTCRPDRRPHNPPGPLLTFRQTARVQQPPRRRKPRRPNVPPALPQQVKHAQLAPRFPAINQLNPRRDGPIPVADQMLRMLRSQLPGPVNHLGPRTKSPRGRPPSSIANYLQFGSPPAGSRSQTAQFSVPYGGDSGALKGVFRSHWPTVLLTQPTRFPARA